MDDLQTKASPARSGHRAPKAHEASRPVWRHRLSRTVVNILTALVGIATLAAGVGWMVYSYIVNLEVSYFAIPLVLTVPVIVAVAFRNCWD